MKCGKDLDQQEFGPKRLDSIRVGIGHLSMCIGHGRCGQMEGIGRRCSLQDTYLCLSIFEN